MVVLKPHQKGSLGMGECMTCEFIGRQVVVVDASNKSLKGVSGEVVGESRETLELLTRNGVKRILKRGVHLQFESGQIVDGSLVAVRSAERLKLDAAKLVKRRANK